MVGDAGLVQPAELAPQRVELVIAQRLADGRILDQIERDARRPDDDEGVALTGAAGGHQLLDPNAGPLGEQRHEPLVLDELDPGEPRRALATPVPREAPQRRQQLGVPGIAAVHLDVHHAARVVTDEVDDASVMTGRRLQVGDLDAELVEGQLDARARRAPAGRADDEVHEGRGQEADHRRRDTAAGTRRAEHDDADHLPDEQPATEVADGSAEVGRRDGDRRGGERDGARREGRRFVEVDEPGDRDPRVAVDRRAHDGGDRDGEDDTGRDVACEGQAPADDGRQHQHDGPCDRCPGEQLPQRIEERWEVIEHRGEARIEVGTDVRQHRRDHQQEPGGDRQRHVRRTTRSRFSRCRCEQDRTRCTTAGRRTRHAADRTVALATGRGSSREADR